MRYLLLIALLLAGCGPSYSDAVIIYENEQKELERLKEKYGHLEKLQRESETIEHSGDPLISKMRDETDQKTKEKLAEWSRQIEIQKQRVEEARQAKEAAR